MKVEKLIFAALGARELALIGCNPIENPPVGKPHIITPEVNTILVRYTIKQLGSTMNSAAELIGRIRDEEEKYGKDGIEKVRQVVDDSQSLDEYVELIQKVADNHKKDNNIKLNSLLDLELIKSLENRLHEVFKQLARLDIMKLRSRQKRESGENNDSESALEGSTAFGSSNIFTDVIGSLGEILGIGSKRRLESLRHHVNSVAKKIYLDQAELSGRLGTLSARMADSIEQLQNDLGSILNNLYAKDRTRFAILHNLQGVVQQAEKAVSYFVEIKDKADLRLPSRMILSEKTLQNYLENTTRKNRELMPIYPDALAYYRLSLAETHFNQEEQMFTTLMRIPMTRETEYFYKDQIRLSHVRMTSDKHHIFLTPQDEVDCHETTTEIVCLNRACKMNKFEDELKSCVVTRSENSHDDILELLYKEPPTNQKIIMMCQGKRMEFPVEHEVIQLHLPQHCSVRNEHFSVDNVITADVTAITELQDNELNVNFKEVSLNATEEEFVSKIQIKSPATIQIVEDLRQEARSAQESADEKRKHANSIDDKYGAYSEDFLWSNLKLVGIVIAVFVAVILFVCFIIKKCF